MGLEKCAIYEVDGHGFVFDLETLRVLREEYNLPGVLTGTLKQFPQQNVFNGLPLKLLPEEVRFLTELGGCEIVGNAQNFIKPVNKRYDVFKYLVMKKYFVLPGLRFGCDFMAYPGDFMKFHSHFNVVGKDYEEKFKIMDIVNGGRLATSVKKCWVVGGKDEEVQVFSIEWAGFG